ncbi:MAG: BrxA/BrxB family bacilliredoxin [Bacillaceae bacterium]
MMNAYEQYMREISRPMREELTQGGFVELTTEEAVEDFMSNTKGTAFVVINSVCGCAAGLARPAAVGAVMESEKKPDAIVTVFAGQDREATAKMRSYFPEVEPSSPSMMVIKDGQLAHFIPREHIEGHAGEEVLMNILNAFEKYCE